MCIDTVILHADHRCDHSILAGLGLLVLSERLEGHFEKKSVQRTPHDRADHVCKISARGLYAWEKRRERRGRVPISSSLVQGC